ncbi:lysophospholipid acyltransferase family protein [Chlorobium limicola]|uniref:Lipid A biosynthesis acyltransferase n=1 Tax=Chlorobium limicola TaxID=1092 RepID=A0A101JLR3_CHLLI|nr:lysophospholipid acyltransferase family protein [Chlorobium limicola]KUL28716.1 lipid A biosynthesis acyltransferase [Chlorobium limicola]
MSKKKNRFPDNLFYRLLLLSGMIVRRLNRSHSAAMARILGDIVFDLLKIRRDLVETNLSLTFPEKSGEEISRIARQVYRNLAANAVEVLRLPLIRTPEDATRLVDVDVRDFLAKTRDRNNGAVCVSAHFGNWELLAVSLGLLISQVTVVVKRLKNRDIDRQINRWRGIRGNTIVYKRQALREGLRTLRRGGIMSFLADQSDPEGGFFMDFLGRRTSVFLGPAYLALKTGVPLFVVMCRRSGGGRYIAEFEEVDTAGLGSDKGDAEELTRRYTRVLERYIRQYPEEWFWVHNRWKRTEESLPFESGEE